MAETEESYGERLVAIEEELESHTSRLRIKAEKYTRDAAGEADPTIKRMLTMGSEILQEVVDTSLDFQTEVVGIVREAIEDGLGTQDELIGIEAEHADVILLPLVNYKSALVEWIAAQPDVTIKAQLQKQLTECEAAIALVNELVLDDKGEEAPEAAEAAEEPN